MQKFAALDQVIFSPTKVSFSTSKQTIEKTDLTVFFLTEVCSFCVGRYVATRIFHIHSEEKLCGLEKFSVD
jgi:hypothetical protein